MKLAAFLCPAMLVLSTPALAGELFGGLYAHDVKLPTDKSGLESGADIQIGYRGGAIAHTPIQPYIFGALNTAGDTSYAAVGLSAKFGGRIYVRPGLGLAIHNGSAGKFFRTDKIGNFRSSAVAMDKDYRWLSAHRPAPFAWQTQDLHRSGAIGDASAANADKGRQVLAHGAGAFVELLADVHQFDPAIFNDQI